MKVFWEAFMCWQFWLCNFWHKEISAKDAGGIYVGGILRAVFMCWQFCFAIFWCKEIWQKSCS